MLIEGICVYPPIVLCKISEINFILNKQKYQIKFNQIIPNCI